MTWLRVHTTRTQEYQTSTSGGDNNGWEWIEDGKELIEFYSITEYKSTNERLLLMMKYIKAAELAKRIEHFSTPFPEPSFRNHQKPRPVPRVWKPIRG